MKVCFVCGEYPPHPHGGIGSMVQTLGRALAAAGHEVRVIGLYQITQPVVREIDAGVHVWRMRDPAGWGGWIAGRRALFRQVARWARAGEIDLVEVPDWQGWAAYWRPLPVPIVTRLNGSAAYFAAEMGRRARRITAHLERRSLERSDYWCSVSRYTARRTQALFDLASGPAAILPNAVEGGGEPAPWAARQPGKVVFTGTLTEKKGIVALIDAWARVAERRADATLHVLGKDGRAPGGGSMIAYLNRRLCGDAARRVRFAGHLPREQVLAELQTARLAVFPSFAEAFALAPVEAMAAGCPTIGSALGSGPELIQHGVDGLTVDPRDPAKIAHAILRLLGDERLARTLAGQALEKVERRFTWQAMKAANLQFYAECVARGPRGAKEQA